MTSGENRQLAFQPFASGSGHVPRIYFSPELNINSKGEAAKFLWDQ